MKLSIIVPVFNEEKTVGQIIQKLANLKIPNAKLEIIVVNDGSTDKTSYVVKNVKSEVNNLKLINLKINQGKGFAIRTGLIHAHGDYVLIQDADTEYNPNDIARLIKPIQDGAVQVVYGTRLKRLPNFLRDEKTVRFAIHYFGNKFLSFVTSILYGQWITDMETGYKIFPIQAIKKLNLTSYGFDFEPEITAKLLRLGYKIKEIPIQTNPRGYDEGKKLNTVKDGLMALYSLFKFRFID